VPSFGRDAGSRMCSCRAQYILAPAATARRLKRLPRASVVDRLGCPRVSLGFERGSNPRGPGYQASHYVR